MKVLSSSTVFARARAIGALITVILIATAAVLPFSANAAAPAGARLSATGRIEERARARAQSGTEAQPMTRGAFIRDAVKAIGISLKESNDSLPFARVPKALLPAVAAAHRLQALAVFGDDLRLSRSVTRGEAVRVLVALLSLKPRGVAQSFGDVKVRTPDADAVQIAIEEGWMEPMRPNFFGYRRVLTMKEAEVLLRKVRGEGVQPTQAPRAPVITIRYKSRERTTLPKEDLLRTVWQMLTEQYLRRSDIKAEDAAYAAAEAMVKSLGDPYTAFLRPVQSKEFRSQIQGEVSGIGAQVEYKDDHLIVVSPLPHSPAERAGLKPGDVILEADGVVLRGLGLVPAVEKVRGPRGSAVRLKIRRNGEGEFILEIVRDVVKVAEVDVSFQGEVAVVKIIQFGQVTERELRSVLEKVQQRRPHGIILDLRNNPGGLLHTAGTVLSNFLPKGSVFARIVAPDGEDTETTELAPTIAADIPLVVLVNKGSASASEIVAGALQDGKRAVVIGEKTFGKGTVQQVVEFNDGSSLKMTIAEWKTPAGRVIDGTGIEPDIVVEAGDGGRDEQMLRALELLR